MTWAYTDEYYKNYTRETWDECAKNYLPIINQLAPYHQALLRIIAPRKGEVVLDVCTGPGEPALTIADLVNPSGYVVGVDLSSNMTEIATKTASKRHLDNVKFLTMDAEKLELPDENFDLATSCFGFQIITNPEAAAKEIFRVIKSGSRAGFTVWSQGDRAAAIDVMIGPMLEYAEPDESGYLPTPYELGGQGELTSMLEKIGFINTKETRVTGTWKAPSVEEYLRIILDGTPLGHSLKEESAIIQEKVIQKTKENISRYKTVSGIIIPAECVIVSATKQSNQKKKQAATTNNRLPITN